MSDCLTPSRLERLADQSGGDVDGEKHLAECDVCRAAVEELRSNREFIAAIAGPLRSAIERPIPDAPRAEQSFFPGYRRLDVLGHGGQAVVHRAIHEASGRIVAIKVLRFGSIRQRARLAREAQLAATLRHPGIVTIHDCGDLPEGGFAIVMELVDGVPLDAWSTAVRSATDASPQERRKRIAQLFVLVCDAVAHAHHNGVIHRDLKPANVLVGADDQPRVLDFGVAHTAHPGSAPAITRTDEFSGTLAYAAPETLSNSAAPAGTLADVYALGVMLHEAVVGRSPHRVDGSVETIVRAVVDSEPTRPTADVDGAAIEADLSVIMVKALARDPARRYDSPTALARDLDNWIADRPIDARSDSLTYLARVFVRRNRLAVASTIAVMVLLAGSVVALAILYGSAESARADLANQLFERNLEQALMLASAERPGPAEALAWREALAPSSPRAVGAAPTDPDFLALLWTLRQIVAGNPCLSAAVVEDRSPTSMVALDDASVAIAWNNGAVTRVHCPDLAVAWTTSVEHAGPAREPLLAWDQGSGQLAATVDRQQLALIEPMKGTEHTPISIPPSVESNWIRAMSFDHAALWIAWADGDALQLDCVANRIIGTTKTPPWSSMGWMGDLRLGMLVSAPKGTASAIAYDLSRGAEIGRFALKDDGSEGWRIIAICGDGRVLIPSDAGICRWNPRTSEVREAAPMRAVMERIIAPFGAADPLAVVITDGGILHVVDIERQEHIGILSGHPSRQAFRYCAAWIAPETLVTAGPSGFVRMWDVRPGRWISVHPAHRRSIGRIAFAPDGHTLVTFGRDETLATWDYAESIGAPNLRPLPEGVTSYRAAISPDCSLIALEDRGDPRRAIVRRMSDFLIISDYGSGGGIPGPIDFSPDGHHVVFGLEGLTERLPALGIFDVKAKTWRSVEMGKRGGFRAIRHSPDGRFLAWADTNAQLSVMETDADVRPDPRPLPGSARAVVFSPDSERILTGFDDGKFLVSDRRSGAVLATIPAHGFGIADIAWSPDGQLIATASTNGEVALWCATTYRRLASMPPTPMPMQTLVFSPDSDRLLIGDDAGNLIEWNFGYYDKAIARSVDAWIELLRRDGVETPNGATMREWARAVVR